MLGEWYMVCVASAKNRCLSKLEVTLRYSTLDNKKGKVFKSWAPGFVIH